MQPYFLPSVRISAGDVFGGLAAVWHAVESFPSIEFSSLVLVWVMYAYMRVSCRRTLGTQHENVRERRGDAPGQADQYVLRLRVHAQGDRKGPSFPDGEKEHRLAPALPGDACQRWPEVTGWVPKPRDTLCKGTEID